MGSQTTPTTTRYRDTIIQMFLDSTTGESYAEGRLKTTRVNDDTVALIAYHKHKIAEYRESDGTVTLFTGHYGQTSETVNRYIARTAALAGEREGRSVIPVETSPDVRARPVTDSAQYIGEYVDIQGSMSDADRMAVREVNDALRSAF